jgi:hypothetical protein
MNIVIGMLIVALGLLLVRPVQAVNDSFVDGFIPSLMQNSLKMPALAEVLASGEVRMMALDGSGEKGRVSLREVPENMDTRITVKVSGLDPNTQYVPIYYQNRDCETEDSSIEKSIKGAFYPDASGNGEIEDTVKDSMNRIGSVSIRTSRDFELVACGKV